MSIALYFNGIHYRVNLDEFIYYTERWEPNKFQRLIYFLWPSTKNKIWKWSIYNSLKRMGIKKENWEDYNFEYNT